MLIITNGEQWHYIVLKSVSTDDGFNRPTRSLSRLSDNNDFCHVEMPTKDNRTLKYNHGEKSLKAPFTIYADLECLLIKKQFRQNNPN